jgi:hypothetical protein
MTLATLTTVNLTQDKVRAGFGPFTVCNINYVTAVTAAGTLVTTPVLANGTKDGSLVNIAELCEGESIKLPSVK